jgi:hypothetical protein
VKTLAGQEKAAKQRREIFSPYQVTERLLGAARPEAVFLHCLPAHRGEEVRTLSWSRPAPSSSTKPKTVFTLKRPCC